MSADSSHWAATVRHAERIDRIRVRVEVSNRHADRLALAVEGDRIEATVFWGGVEWPVRLGAEAIEANDESVVAIVLVGLVARMVKAPDVVALHSPRSDGRVAYAELHWAGHWNNRKLLSVSEFDLPTRSNVRRIELADGRATRSADHDGDGCRTLLVSTREPTLPDPWVDRIVSAPEKPLRDTLVRLLAAAHVAPPQHVRVPLDEFEHWWTDLGAVQRHAYEQQRPWSADPPPPPPRTGRDDSVRG